MEYPNRKCHRLKGWDYSQPGYYYITICTKNKRKILGTVQQVGLDAAVIPSEIGKQVIENWKLLETIYPNIQTDYFCLMPNHIHGILIVKEADPQKSLPDILRGFKSVTTRQYNKLVSEQEKNKLWQSSFYDEIIRNDAMLLEIRKYIFGNPSKWLEDDLYIE